MKYTRLPGKKKGFYRKCTLWLGEDHILAVESNYYSENYKRFYFKDFQALIVRKTNRFSNLNIFMAIAIGVAALLLLLSVLAHYIGLIIFLGVVLLCLVISLAVHLKRGPTCACHLKMPFAVHELPSLCRQKYVRRVLERLTPMVQKFQGSLSVEDIRSKIREKVSGPSAVNSAQAGIMPLSGPAEEYSCFAHMFVFGLLLLNAAFALLWLYSNHPLVKLSNLATGSALLILAIVALIRQSRRSVPRVVKGLAWTVLVIECYFSFHIAVLDSVVRALKIGQAANRFDHIGLFLSINPASHPLLRKSFICYIVVGAVIGLWGLAAIMMHRSRTGKLIPVSADNAVPSLAEQVES